MNTGRLIQRFDEYSIIFVSEIYSNILFHPIIISGVQRQKPLKTLTWIIHFIFLDTTTYLTWGWLFTNRSNNQGLSAKYTTALFYDFIRSIGNFKSYKNQNHECFCTKPLLPFTVVLMVDVCVCISISGSCGEYLRAIFALMDFLMIRKRYCMVCHVYVNS